MKKWLWLSSLLPSSTRVAWLGSPVQATLGCSGLVTWCTARHPSDVSGAQPKQPQAFHLRLGGSLRPLPLTSATFIRLLHVHVLSIGQVRGPGSAVPQPSGVTRPVVTFRASTIDNRIPATQPYSSKLFTTPSRLHHPLCDTIRFKDDPWNDRMAKAVQLFIEGRRILEFEPTATRLPGPAPPQKPPRT